MKCKYSHKSKQKRSKRNRSKRNRSKRNRSKRNRSKQNYKGGNNQLNYDDNDDDIHSNIDPNLVNLTFEISKLEELISIDKQMYNILHNMLLKSKKSYISNKVKYEQLKDDALLSLKKLEELNDDYNSKKDQILN